MKVLVVIDMQNDFIDGALGSDEAEAIVDNVVRKIREFNGGMILVTMDTHGEDYLKTQEGRKLPVPHCIKGDDGWNLRSEVMAALKESGCDVRYFEKDTFGSKEMAMRLLEMDLFQDFTPDEIELIGLCTDICVISNAVLLKAFFPETPISVDASCCAGVTPPTHENALIAMKLCQINIKNWDDTE